MNNVILTGNLVKECELKYTSGKGTAVLKNTLAVRRDKDNTDFINIVVWGKAAETVCQYCSKGSKIGVEGSIRTGSYDNKEGKKVYTTEVHSMRIELLGQKADNQADNNKSNKQENDFDLENGVDDQDLPF